jgi:hypothetical protein
MIDNIKLKVKTGISYPIANKSMLYLNLNSINSSIKIDIGTNMGFNAVDHNLKASDSAQNKSIHIEE